MRNVYLELTEQFNRGRFRAIICSGQAVVLHKLAIMSKDGDWIVREDEESLAYIRSVLSKKGAGYRFGAPFDTRWLSGGWSSHFDFQDAFRVRTDFFTRPPRIPMKTLDRLWSRLADRNPPFLDPPELADMKKTNREKDYVVIGELARIMTEPADKLLYSRSARDLVGYSTVYTDLIPSLAQKRPLLLELDKGVDHVARLLDEERRELIKINERRLEKHARAAADWAKAWPGVAKTIGGLPLEEAHAIVVQEALNHLPFTTGEFDHE